MPRLVGRPVRETGQGCGERLVIRVGREWAAFQELPEMTYRGIQPEEFTVEGAVLDLCRGKLPGKECDGFPGLPVALLERAADVRVGGVHRDARMRVRARVVQ